MSDSNLVRFNIFAEGQVYLSPYIQREYPVDGLLDDWEPRPKLLTDDIWYDCKLYKFSTPIEIRSTDSEATADACFDVRDGWVEIDHLHWVEELGGDEYLDERYVCLAVEIPKGPHDRAVSELEWKHRRLFRSLQIIIEDIRSWSKQDVMHNLQGGSFWSNEQEPSGAAAEPMLALEKSLAENRCYAPDGGSTHCAKDVSTAVGYKSPFAGYFVEGDRAMPHVKDSRESAAFHSVLRCHHPDSKRVADDDSFSESFKASQLSTYFFIPPFFSCQHEHSKTVFKPEMRWKFPIFIATHAEKSDWCKYTPDNECWVFVKDFLCPLLISEIISDSDLQQTVRYRMLLQAIAAVRAANVLRKPDSQKPCFVVAVGLHADLIAERYIVMQTGQEKEVSIVQRNYNLKECGEALDFLKNMFNLRDTMEDLARDLDAIKQGSLSAVADIADPMTSLAQKRKESSSKKGSGTLDSDPEEHPFTEDPEIQKYLTKKGCVVAGHLFGFPNVAFISRKSGPSGTTFLKLSKRGSEATISRFLADTRTPENHTIAGLEVLPLSSGDFVIYTHSGGSHLVDLNIPDLHMWDAAKQLVEGIAFMHNKNVAHLDIKPANVLMPPDGGRLSIIDFSISVIVAPGLKLLGMKGTKGYMAPEVRKEGTLYDPIRADLWSCGKTLERLTSVCKESTKEKDFLVGIIGRLMADDPLERPMMSEVLDLMKAFDDPISTSSTPLVTSDGPRA